MINENKPLYIQIKEYILQRIKDGTYKPEEVIPTERALCSELDVSRQTVRRAIQDLVYEGYLYRVQGAGTYVFDKKLNESKKSNNIGVILNRTADELESKLLSGIESYIEKHGYTLTFMNSNEDYRKEAENIQKLKNNGVAGIIIMPSENQQDSSAISDLKDENYPFVLVDRKIKNCETDAVVSDNIDGAFQATKHLIDLGHQKIVFIKNRYTITSSIQDRITGYKKALKEYGFEDDEILFLSYNENEKNDDQIYDEIYEYITKNKITGIVALNDYIGLLIVKMARKKNLKIPKDFSIVGFDNNEVVKHIEVPLTTIAQFPEKIGYHAAELLIQKINNKNSNDLSSRMVHQIYYPTKLIIRSSTQNI
ncbi:GntR family transcriptional regulator [Oceanotoga sp. DSM 15011]|jgi:GntR family transcriptional regulator of arabinose operon|uniref:GntR family transcriptional regulator n=1 Tax=Oceanotoga teriensis TaxID=515440 RepID=A0AA45C4M9_9BACT|nr:MULTISPECIES: GntR family transcriptional regulator [Oceanotoga]MDN5343467.1 GntR family transcriptional regulator, arabinose operon transcriptional repressor [Oceanotoga sp.]PWJ86895.1 GntR family transcriptional regulator [Oceanotoga teriensis]UYO99221.1 GntR family transcriptional regulator [Oceanotoga sp. DSM 15011]